MPAAGDQHRSNGNITANPFDEPKARMSEYTAQEIETLQNKLNKQLGPEYLSSRPGGGGNKFHYVAAEKVIGLANEVFGFNGWNSSIQNVQIDFIEENPSNGKVRMGIAVIVRVTLKDGTYHEDIGYGSIENAPGKAAAFEKCKKEGTTDALKRALRTFGNVLGNCIYDKDYLQRVTKIKVQVPRWNPDNLHRAPEYAPVKTEVREAPAPKLPIESDTSHTEIEDDFGGSFDEADFSEKHFGNPDEVAVPAAREPLSNGPSRPIKTESKIPPLNPNPLTTPSKPLRPPDPDQVAHIERQRQLALGRRNAALAAQKGQSASTTQPRQNLPQAETEQRSSSPGLPSHHFAQQDEPALPPIPFVGSNDTPMPPIPAVGFLSARSVGADSGQIVPTASSQFNPHAESPSIRKTVGVDHSRSAKVTRDLIGAKAISPNEGKPPSGPGTNGVATRDFVNPSADMTRRIGAPGGLASPMMTKSYRPPTLKRPADVSGVANVTGGQIGQPNASSIRQPLSDVGNVVGATAGTGGPNDIKRPRTIPSQGLPGPPGGVENLTVPGIQPPQRPLPGAN